MADSILRHFGNLPDPRKSRGRLHRLSDLLAIAICAVVCGADGWVAVEHFARAKEEWFATFLGLPNGIPSHDTFGRVFAAIDPDAFERCFAGWTAAPNGSSKGKLVSIDGKGLRRSFAHAWDRSGMAHLVSAFVSENRLVLGQLAVDAKENEVVAIPRLLGALDLTGATVTIDAIGCQRDIARRVLDAGAQYVLAVKGNQKTLHQQVKKLLGDAILGHFHGMAHDSFQETGGGHGRVETRRAWCTGEVHWIQCGGDWPGLASVGVVECVREVMAGPATTERRDFISSLPGTDAKAFAAAVRGHWAVENPLHWSLDVTFAEDDCRVRTGHAAQNLSRLRRIALNQLRREKTLNAGIHIKRQTAGWDHDYLLKVLAA